MFFENTLLDLVARGFALGAMGIFWVVVLIRLNGLRSLSKMTNFDFVMTIALGSLLATAAGADSWQVFGQSLAAQAALFFVQWGTAKLRRSSDTIETVMQNAPVFLMRDGQFCEDALDTTRVAKSDVIAKLREFVEAGAYKFVLRPIGNSDAEMVEHTRLLIDEVLPAVYADGFASAA